MSDRPLLILVGIGFEPHRGYLLRAIAETTDVWLLDDEQLSWESPYVVGHTFVDIRDGAALLTAALDVAGRRPVAGVLCWDELKMANTARVVERLGLPGVSPDVIDRCRDKHRTRTALAVAAVPQPRSTVVDSLAAAVTAARDIGFPVILKPRALGASMGVTLVESAADIPAAYAHTRAQHVSQARYYTDGVLVEEYANGPEFSVDSACVNGATFPLFLARKTSGFAPYFEEVGHVVDGDDPLLRDPELRAVLTNAHRALEFDSGMTHVELRRTDAGWKVIEVNCRLGGDLIPYLGWLATGIDAGQVAAAVACGRTPSIAVGHRRVAAIRFCYPPAATVVGEVLIDKELLPANVLLAEPLAAPGVEVAPPPDGHVWGRYAMVVATGDTVAECGSTLDQAVAAVSLVAGPADSRVQVYH